ncbi:MAG: hypothetical protein LQ342_002054 [Letrouitia transgressa]|nr:MAG: hypothetical protein LQ342_002054 [Letrouitia transgressa]
MKYPLRAYTIAATGNFGNKRPHDMIKQWVEKNGGTFVMQAARKIKTLKIVTYDWLEDSLLARSPKGVANYLLKQHVKVEKKRKAKQKEKVKETVKAGMTAFHKGCEDISKDIYTVEKDTYHIYTDSTLFPYSVTLVRANIATNKSERYVLKVCPPGSIFPITPNPRARTRLVDCPAQTLQLCESNDTPKAYTAYVNYHTPGCPIITHILAPLGSGWDTAFGAFKKFFKVKTSIEWDRRLLERGKMEEGKFWYLLPAEGEAVGLLLKDYGLSDFGDTAVDAVEDI